MGVTQEEITEVLHVAMTVGATRMQVMVRAEAAKLEPPPAAAQPTGAGTDTTGGGPTFEAAEVVAQADGG